MKAQRESLDALIRGNFEIANPSNKSKMDLQQPSVTCCHLPTQVCCVFGTAASSRLEADWLQPGLKLHTTFRTCLIVLTRSASEANKPL